MTTYNKASLAAFFQQGDVPTGTDYNNLIDSQVNIAETSAQVMAGPLNPTELITPRVSATDVNVTGNLTIAGILSAFTLSLDRITVSAVTSNTGAFSGIVSAASLNVTGDVSAVSGTVYASAMRSQNGILVGVGVVSALGSTQATAAPLAFIMNRGKGIVDGSTTGFAVPGNRIGLTQYLFNEGASANLYPPVGGTLNGLAANAAFPLVASAMVTIIHLTASAMAVK